MHINIICNPGSGSFRKATLNRLCAELQLRGATVTVTHTLAGGGADIDMDAELICIYGGDGAVRQVIEAMLDTGTDTPLAVYPSGTINLIARELGYERKTDRFAEQVIAAHRAGQYLSMPLVMSHSGPIVACASGGPDSLAVAGLSPRLKSRIGRFAYVVSLCNLMLRWPRHTISVVSDRGGKEERTLQGEAVLLARGRYYAGPWTLAREAGLASPHFHAVVMHSAKRTDFLKLVLAMGLHRPLDAMKNVSMVTTSKLEMSCESGLPLQIDGDAAGECLQDIYVSDAHVKFCVDAG